MNIYFDIKSALNKEMEINKKLNFFINKKGVLFPISLNIRESENLVIFFPGAYDTSKPMPRFQRSNYFQELPYSSLSFFDPTLFLSRELSIGWFQGRYNNTTYLDLLSEITEEIISFLKIKNENILFFASSAGGIPAIKIATNYKLSNIYAGNIQTDIFKYRESHYKKLLKALNIESVQEYKEKYPNDYHIFNINTPIKIFYAQNISDDFHYKNHYLPFIKKMKDNKIILKNLVYQYNPEKGSPHNPISKNIELKIILSIIEKSDIYPALKKYIYKPQ